MHNTMNGRMHSWHQTDCQDLLGNLFNLGFDLNHNTLQLQVPHVISQALESLGTDFCFKKHGFASANP